MLLAAGLGFLPVACEDRGSNGTNTTPPPADRNVTPPSHSTPPANTPATPDADNTARNERDRNTNAPTPVDQGQTQKDLDITAEIRRALMSDSAMSINAQNCKIITQNGAVTLRGPVASQAEKDAIAAKAKAVPGVSSVTNELEVKTGG
jgi:hypothetical protein